MVHAGEIFKGNISQRPDELEAFIGLLIRERVRSYLEIGLRIGVTFREIGLRLPPRSVLVGVDMPGAIGGVHQHDAAVAIAEIERTAAMLRRHQQEVAILWGDSRLPAIIDSARRFSPYDAILIDGDHSSEGVRSDWEAYSPMGRIVAFHDIDAGQGGLRPKKLARYGVPALWQELKPRYRHREIIGAKRGMGLGVIWVRDGACNDA
jgi:cephalosporin hydroxylase